MAFSDPTAVTIAAVAKNLVRIDSGRMQSEYFLAETTQSFRLYIRSADLKKELDGRYKTRHNLTLIQTIFATSTTPEITRKATFTIEHYAGDDPAAYDDVGIAVAAMVTAGNVVKLNNYES